MKFEIKNLAVEFTFDCHLKGTQRIKFYRELYGCKIFSNNSKYIYIKDGILSEIKHIRPTRSTIILLKTDAKILRNYFKKHDCKFDERIIFLNKTDAKDLGIKFESAWEKIMSEIKGNSNLLFSLDIE